jgi:hypothetical protein
MRKFLTLCSAAGIASLIAAGSALAAAYPTSVLGTWTIRANDTQPFTFTVQTQSSDAPCAVITGVLGAPNDTIQPAPSQGRPTHASSSQAAIALASQ